MGCELFQIWKATEDPFRVTKQILRTWTHRSAMELCWAALRQHVDVLCSEERPPPDERLRTVYEALRLLHACDPAGSAAGTVATPGHPAGRAGVAIASVRTMLRLLGSSNMMMVTIGAGHPGRNPQRQRRVFYATPPNRQQLIELIEHMETHRVPTLATLAVHALRCALSSSIDSKLEGLLRALPPQQQRILRPQVLLDDLLGAHRVEGLDEALTSVEVLHSMLSS